MSSRSLDDLHPVVRRMAREHVDLCAEQGIDLLIYCTLRSPAEQDALYKIGRTVHGRIVTCARGGDSMHNYGLAYDAVPIIAGKPQWNDMTLIRRMGHNGEAVGLEWAGRWQGKFQESVHFQWTGGLELAELKAGQRPPEDVA